jgi:hypothetical protein
MLCSARVVTVLAIVWRASREATSNELRVTVQVQQGGAIRREQFAHAVIETGG